MHWFKSFLASVGGVLLITQAAVAAEFISFSIIGKDFTLSIDTLETYLAANQLGDQESAVLDGLLLDSLSNQEQIREVLQSRYQLDPLAVEGLFQSSMVEEFLYQIGEAIRTEDKQNGAIAIQAALKQAAGQEEGFTLLDILRQFPGEKIQIDPVETLEILVEVGQLIQQTDAMLESLEKLAAVEAAQTPRINWNQALDLRQSGTFRTQRQELTIANDRRGGELKADLYLPTPLNRAATATATGTVPVIVISHGLASGRRGFEPLARHLASYGFVVAVPQHPGSDRGRLEALLKGETAEFFDLQEFIDRPLDVSDVLDHLEELNTSQFNQALNLETVGMFGHSFGGYTALSLAGARIDFAQLETDCQPNQAPTNPSLFLQCQALQLSDTSDTSDTLDNSLNTLRDERVQAVAVLNPVNRSLFGQAGLSQIKIPVMMIGSSKDLLAPLVTEQIRPFTWLTTPRRYLVVKENDHHFYESQEMNQSVLPNIGGLVESPTEVTRGYVNALGTAFFKTYVAEEPDYERYLGADYGQWVSESPLNLFVVQSLSEAEVSQVLDRIERRWRN